MRNDRLNKRKQKTNLHVLVLLASILILSIGINLIMSKRASTISPVPQTDAIYDQVEIASVSVGHSSAEYPVFHLKNIDDYMESYIHSRLASFNHAGEEKTITYEILHYSKQTLSVSFSETDTLTEIMTFDLKTQSILSFDDLILKEKMNEGLDLLAEIAQAELNKSSTLAMSSKDISTVTAPKADNYSQFIIYNQAIVFHLSLPDKKDTHQIAVSKHLLDDMLVNTYKAGEIHDDFSGNYEPANIITERPTMEGTWLMDEKVVALTFDDGPRAGVTNVILDALDKYDAKATFFVLGSRCEANTDLLKRMADEGHEIGNHTWDHPKMTSEGASGIVKQIDRTNEIVKQITGIAPTLFRPPYGLYDERVSSYVGKENLILWDVDTLDWKLRHADSVMSNTLCTVKEGNIMLMHDIYSSSAEAAVSIIRELSRQGYQFVTVSELLEIKKQRLEDSTAQ